MYKTSSLNITGTRASVFARHTASSCSLSSFVLMKFIDGTVLKHMLQHVKMCQLVAEDLNHFWSCTCGKIMANAPFFAKRSMKTIFSKIVKNKIKATITIAFEQQLRCCFFCFFRIGHQATSASLGFQK